MSLKDEELSNETEVALDNFTTDLITFLKVNKNSSILQNELNILEEFISSHLIRLDEFKHLLKSMSNTKTELDNSLLTPLSKVQDNLQHLFHRIDTLESYINNQEHTITQLELRMKQVCHTYGKPKTKQQKLLNSFKSLLKPNKDKSYQLINKKDKGYISLSIPATKMLVDTSKYFK